MKETYWTLLKIRMEQRMALEFCQKSYIAVGKKQPISLRMCKIATIQFLPNVPFTRNKISPIPASEIKREHIRLSLF